MNSCIFFLSIATFSLSKFEVALNNLIKIVFFNFAKSCISSCLSQFEYGHVVKRVLSTSRSLEEAMSCLQEP